jgi:hypothetical protein
MCPALGKSYSVREACLHALFIRAMAVRSIPSHLELSDCQMSFRCDPDASFLISKMSRLCIRLTDLTKLVRLVRAVLANVAARRENTSCLSAQSFFSVITNTAEQLL